MNTPATPSDDTHTDGDIALEVAAISGEIAAQLEIVPLSTDRNLLIAGRLMERARLSAAAHQRFVTWRREDLVLTADDGGQKAHTIRQDAALKIQIVQIKAGAQFVWPERALAQEVLVLDGALIQQDGSQLGRHELVLMSNGTGLWKAGPNGARLYVRELHNLDALPSAERTWWTQAADPVRPEWRPRSPGLDMKDLRCVGSVVSKLARLVPGGRLRDHDHALDEDCMMLEGELLMGDILLRQDDYQLAPVGVPHVNAVSEPGALFYIHGNIVGAH